MLNNTFTPFPVLLTKRLTLRQLAAGDEAAIFSLRSDAEVNKFLDRKIAATPDDARQFINIVNDNIANNKSLYWAITFFDNNELVGTICLFSFSDEEEKCEIGYELLTKFQGQGIMQEAAEKVIDYAFNCIGVKEVEAFFHKDNQRTIKLLEKCAFKQSDITGNTDPDLKCYSLKRTVYQDK